MTISKELGVKYNQDGNLLDHNPNNLFLNAAGVERVKKFTTCLGFETEEVQVGFPVTSLKEGSNTYEVEMVLPTKDGNTCSVPIFLSADYFLPQPTEAKIASK